MMRLVIIPATLAFLVAPSSAVARQADDESGERSGTSTALEGNPRLREQLMETYGETFEQLKENLHSFTLDGTTYYIVEGDLRLDEDELLLYARQRAEQLEEFQLAKLGLSGRDGGPQPSALIVVKENGNFVRWQPGSTLTYCVLEQTFGGDEDAYETAVERMKAATEDWQETCNIAFEHDESQDGATPGGVPPEGITFTVRKVEPTDPGGAPIASAFFPNDPRSRAHVLLFPDYFDQSLGFDAVGVLRHELGHVLGFRHEHIRSEAPAVCPHEPIFGDELLTAYDPQSVMHYFCGGVGSPDLEITVLDRQGARLVYPPAERAFRAPGAQPSASELIQESFRSLTP